jgi:hypothetical protein
MDAKQKAKQITKTVDEADKNAPDDSEVLVPKTGSVDIGGKNYKIHGLPLRFIREFSEVLNVKNDKDFTNGHYRKLLEVVSKSIKEPDIDFIEDNLTLHEVGLIIATSYRISMTGMPNPQGGSKSGGVRGVRG